MSKENPTFITKKNKIRVIQKSIGFDDVRYWGEFTHPISAEADFAGVGIDPGLAKFGIAVVQTRTFWAITVEVGPGDPLPYRLRLIHDLIRGHLLDHVGGLPDHVFKQEVVVEGPSFGSPGRQADLAMARAAAILAAQTCGFDVQLMAPKAIRKAVFGSGLTKAEEVWKELAPDAASAVACAIAAGKKQP